MSDASRSDYFYRLTALWAVAEALLGGMLHGLKLPVTGLLVAGIASVCISWLGRLGSRSILKALLLVLMVKAILSPHTPFGAYFAVALQAGAGALFFRLLPGFRLPTLLTSVFALLQSALQKLLMLTLFFGVGFWEAAAVWVQGVSQRFGLLEGAWLVWGVGLWLGCYALAGLGWGLLALQRPAIWAPPLLPTEGARQTLNEISLPPLRWYRLLLGSFGLFCLLYFSDLPLLLRALTFAAFIWGLAAPLLQLALKWMLRRQQQRYSQELLKVLEMLPQSQALLRHCWQHSRSGGMLMRPLRTTRLLCAYLQPPCSR